MCTVYRPPASTVRFWDDFSARLDGVSRVNPNVIVLGDMNTDVLRPDKSHYYRHLQELCSEHCLRNVVTVATRSPSDTCLDLLLIPVTLSCNTPSVIHLNDVSDHHLLTLDIYSPRFRKPTANKVYVRKPNPHALDEEMCCTHLCEKLIEFPSAGNVNEKTRLLTQSLTKTLNANAPVKCITLPTFTKPKPQPWVTPHLKQLLQQRIHLYRKTLKRPEDQLLLQQYRSIRRQGTLLNRHLKLEYLMNQFQSQRYNPREQ